jgi:hypothetical protein
MLHDGRQRDRERLGEFAHRKAVPVAKTRQQRAPGRVSERRERAVQRVVILNHEVRYHRAGERRQPLSKRKVRNGAVFEGFAGQAFALT